MITLGADPEFFVRDERNGLTVPIIGLIGGSKGKAVPIPGITAEGFGMQEDNVMAEYNIPASRNSRDFARNVVNGWERVSDFVRTKQPHLEVDLGRCARLFTYEQLDHPQAATFGCSTDYSAYAQGEALPAPDPMELQEQDGAWRFAGGHVHIGLETAAPDFVVAQFADVFIGLPSVAMDRQGKRRDLYGSAGRYRPTAYGIEYRTLSNFWIWDEGLAEQIGERATYLAMFMESDTEAVQKLNAEVPWPDVQRAIDTEDEVLAADLIAFLSQDLGLAL